MSQFAQINREESLGRLGERRRLSLCAHLEESVGDTLLRPNVTVTLLTVELDHVAVRPISILRLLRTGSDVLKHVSLREIIKIFER